MNQSDARKQVEEYLRVERGITVEEVFKYLKGMLPLIESHTRQANTLVEKDLSDEVFQIKVSFLDTYDISTLAPGGMQNFDIVFSRNAEWKTVRVIFGKYDHSIEADVEVTSSIYEIFKYLKSILIYDVGQSKVEEKKASLLKIPLIGGGLASLYFSPLSGSGSERLLDYIEKRSGEIRSEFESWLNTQDVRIVRW